MQRRVLIVDDDVVFSRTLAHALERRGCLVVTADTSAAALARAQQHEFDWVVLDLRIGTESGLHLIQPLQASLPAARILLLTGYASIATAVAAIKLGAVQYLAKPAGVEEILSALGEDGRQLDEAADVAPAGEPLSVDRLEWEHIQKVLAQHEGNLSATARALKMHRRTLQRKLAKRPVRA
jgi:two-component system, response regulator RegA